MSLITASYTLAQVESVTRRPVIQRFFRETGFGMYGTATGGSTTTIIDTTALLNTQYSNDIIPGGWARISYDAGGSAAAPESEIRAVSSYVASTGTVTTSAFSTAVASGDKYELWRFVHPQVVLDTLDQVLAEDCYVPHVTFLTAVPDGDMEQNNTTDWAATNASIAKSTSEPQMWGKRYMTIATSSSGGYVVPATVLKVVPGQKYLVMALVRASAASTTVQLTAYDVSNSATIATVSTTSQTDVWLYKEFTAPTDCYQVALRVGCAENGVTGHLGFLVFQDMESRDLPLPWWVRNRQQVKAIIPASFTAGPTADTYAPMPYGTPDEGRWDFVDRSFGRGQLSIVSRHGSPIRPVYIYGTRNETAFANDNTDTKRIDANWLAACLNYRVFDQLAAQPNASLLDMDWIKERAARWEKIYMRERQKQAGRANIQAETQDALIYKRRPESHVPTVR